MGMNLQPEGPRRPSRPQLFFRQIGGKRGASSWAGDEDASRTWGAHYTRMWWISPPVSHPGVFIGGVLSKSPAKSRQER